LFPGIRYCGQSATENQNASGVMDIAEETVFDGIESHGSDNRWADYAEMSIDPSDDATFWFTTEYARGNREKATKIVSFQFQPAVIYDNDLGVNSMISPISGTELTDTEKVEVSIRNYGRNTITNPTIYYQMNDGDIISETLTGTLDSGAVANFIFSQTVDLSEIGSYDFKIYTGLTDDENRNNDTIYRTVVHSLPTYCGATGDGSDEYINSVNYASISNTSSSSQYSDFTAYTTPAALGTSKEITVIIGNAYDTDQCLVWIDFNQDYTFDENEKVYESSKGKGPHTGTITIPNDALLGSTRMRVRLHDTSGWSSPNEDPCGSSGYGEVEDYTIEITKIDAVAEIKNSLFLQIMPNPVAESLVISSDKILSGDIQIVDVTGKTVYSSTFDGSETRFDFSTKAEGIYLVKLIEKGLVVETVKFVVKH